MKSTLSKVLIFAAGAAVGSVATWKILETKYARLAQEEINSVKEVFAKRYGCNKPVQVDSEETDCSESMGEYQAILSSSGYTNYSDISGGKTDEGVPDMKTKPYVIAPNDFDTLDDYDAETLTYYADGILTDEWDNPIEDVEGMVGKDSLLHFGEYEDDAVHVRNENQKTDYEILRDCRKYSDVINNNPHLVEVK